MLQAHYRSLMELSDETMAGAMGGIERIDAFYRRLRGAGVEPTGSSDTGVLGRFGDAMDTDLGTPDAVGVVFEAISAANSALDSGDSERAAALGATVTELLGVLGLGLAETESDADIDELVARRDEARRERDFAAADRIRDELKAQGIEIEDTASGGVWRRVR